MKRLTQEDFNQRSFNKFGDKFDLTRAIFKGMAKSITIGCPEHGWIETTPNNYLRSVHGCDRCSPNGTRTLDDFIKLCVDKFGDIYDFSRAVYNGRKNMITIGCPIHGFREYKADLFIESKGGCGLCGYESLRIGTVQFKKDVIEKFGDIFDLSRVDYIGRDNKVIVGCSKHGWQDITPQMLMKNKYGCGVCGHDAKTYTTLEWETIARSIHGDKYDYPDGDYYINSNTKILIYCPVHDYYFDQSPDKHIGKQQQGCHKCAGKKLTNEERIETYQEIHGDRYGYTLVEYEKNTIKIKIECYDHGIFEQTPAAHLRGSVCPKCNDSIGERKVFKYLENLDIMFVQQFRYNDCRGDSNPLPFDFYLPKHNILIEYDGRQHYEYIPTLFHRKGYWQFEKQQRYDKIKTDYCITNDILLIRIRYDEDVTEVLSNYFT